MHSYLCKSSHTVHREKNPQTAPAVLPHLEEGMYFVPVAGHGPRHVRLWQRHSRRPVHLFRRPTVSVEGFAFTNFSHSQGLQMGTTHFSHEVRNILAPPVAHVPRMRQLAHACIDEGEPCSPACPCPKEVLLGISNLATTFAGASRQTCRTSSSANSFLPDSLHC
jgi:hypothetical protein